MKTIRLPAQINRKIGRAMHDWHMLDDGDRVLVAVSGGVDSLVTAWLLRKWQAKAPINYSMEAVHVIDIPETELSTGRPPADRIGCQLERWGVAFTSVPGWSVDDPGPRNCFTCARNRRSQLFDLARSRGCNKLAFGHHKDDLVETFFINALYSGNISTMLPRQDLFDGRLSLIRILAYLEKGDIETIAELAGVEPVENLCPLAGDTRRDIVRELVAGIAARIPGAKASVFSALSNVRGDYLLTERCRMLS